MELKEVIEIGILLDYYKSLLTDKQKKYLLNYFEEDYSLTEIAEMNNVSRQAVYDNIKRGCKLLRNYEEKLNLYKKDKKLYEDLLNLKKNFKIENLEKIIDRFS